MNIISRSLGWLRSRIALGGHVSTFNEDLFTNLVQPTAAGVSVDSNTATNLSAVWAAVNIYSQTLSTLPTCVYKQLDAYVTEERFRHPVATLLGSRPNPYMTSAVFTQALEAHRWLWGNACAEIEWTKGGTPYALWPIHPRRVTPVIKDRALAYDVEQPDGGKVRLPYESMFHVPLYTTDGIWGISPVAYARQSLGLSLATELCGASFFGNGARPGGVLEHPGVVKFPDKLKLSWQAAHGGPGRMHRTALLEEGVKYRDIGIPPEDAQFLETRQFQVLEMARWFNLPPHLLRDLMRATYTNIEHQGLEFIRYSLLPCLVKWEQEGKRKLLIDEDEYLKYNADELYRGDMETRYSAQDKALRGGWKSLDDVRREEGYNPLPDGKGNMYLVPVNMMPVERMRDGNKTAEPEGGVAGEGQG
jgi:HK97 family phage portal protein